MEESDSSLAGESLAGRIREGGASGSVGARRKKPRREAEPAADAGDIVFRIPGSGRGRNLWRILITIQHDFDKANPPSRERLSGSAPGRGRSHSGLASSAGGPGGPPEGGLVRAVPHQLRQHQPEYIMTAARMQRKVLTSQRSMSGSFPSVRDIMAPAAGQRDVNLLSLYLPN